MVILLNKTRWDLLKICYERTNLAFMEDIGNNVAGMVESELQ